VSEENLVVAYWDAEAGEWIKLDSTVNTETNTITIKVSHFTAFTILAYTRPATFTTSDLTISPSQVDIEETVNISLLVTNTGDLTDSYEVILRIDNVVVATKDVTMAGEDSQTVTFTTSKDVAGTYTVNVDGLSGTFVVKTIPALSTPLPAPAPPVAPPVPPAAPVIPPPNWWLIGGIIAGFVVIGVLVNFFVSRKRGAPGPS